MKLAYNTSGWRNFPIETTFERLAAIGYEGVELGIQPSHLPPSSWSESLARQIAKRAHALGLTICNIHLGSPYLLSKTPHEPSFLASTSKLRERRLNLVKKGIEFAAAMGVDLVCLESGPAAPSMARSDCFAHLIDGLEAAIDHGKSVGVRIGIEPSPEHFIRSYTDYLELHLALGGPNFGLCYDLGHAHCVYEDSAAIIGETPELFHIHIEDIKGRVHRHLLPGDGDMAFAPCWAALQESHFDGFVSVELMDHHHDPEQAARLSYTYLTMLAMDMPLVRAAARNASAQAQA